MPHLVAPLLALLLVIVSACGGIPARQDTVATSPAQYLVGLSRASAWQWQRTEHPHYVLRSSALQPAPTAQPPTPPERANAARPVSLPVIAALLCLFALSLFSIIGGVAIKRRFDSISPDR